MVNVRTAYTHLLMANTYPFVGDQAIIEGTLKGVWEKLIGKQLVIDYNKGHLEARRLVNQSCKVGSPDELSIEKGAIEAAYLITSSVIQKDDPDDLKEVIFGQ